MSAVLGSGEHRYRVVENWAKLPDGWEFMDVAAVARRQQGPGLRLQSRRASDDRVRPRGQFPALLGRGRVQARARPAHRRARQPLLHRRRRSHGAQVHDRRQGRAHHRRARQARALHERRAVPSLHAHGAVAQGRDLRLRRLRQRARAQVLARRQAADVMGRVRHASPASSTSPTTSPPTTTAGSTSPTARTTACRCSTATASTRRSGTTCTARAASTAAAASADFVIGELGPGMPVNLKAPNLGPRLTIVDAKGKLIARLGGEDGPGARARQVHRPARPGARLAGRHLRRRSLLHQLEDELPGQADAPRCARCRSWRR